MQALLDDVHAQFIDAVAEGRKLDRKDVVGFADGRVFTGAQARALGMVDELGGLEDAVEGAARMAGLPEHPQVIRPRRRFSIFDLIGSRVGVGDVGLGLGGLPRLPTFKVPLYLMD